MVKNGTLKNLRIFIHDLLKRKGRSFNEDGFSILDLIVAVGVILVLTSSTIGVYNVVNSNAKNTAVTRAANQVLKAAMVFQSDGLEYTTPQGAVDQWESSKGSSKVTVELVPDEDGEIAIKASYGEGSGISIIRSVNPNGSTCIDGVLVGGKNTGDACASGTKDPEIPGPAIGDTVSRLTYKCDVDTTGYLATTGIVSGTKITMAGSNGGSKLIKYSQKDTSEIDFKTVASDLVEMKAGIKYTIIINGQFSTIRTPISKTINGDLKECLISIDKLGEDSKVTSLYYVGGKNFIGVPKEIPSTVDRLYNAFRGAENFNDPNISEWDVSNVNTMYCMLYEAREFNQPLNKWNVSNVESMYALFYRNSKFDQPLDKWNTGKARNMQSMFAGTPFNQDISMWDTSNVETMKTMFSSNSKFDQDLSEWNVEKVIDHTNFGSYLNSDKFPKFK